MLRMFGPRTALGSSCSRVSCSRRRGHVGVSLRSKANEHDASLRQRAATPSGPVRCGGWTVRGLEMHPIRRRRLIAVAFLLVGSGATAALVGVALKENINLYYPPAKIVSGAVPVGARIRAGGMVANGSVKHAS